MTRRGLLLFAAMAVIWGIPYLLIRVVVAEIEPAVLVFVRTTLATAILLPLAIARRELAPALRHWRWVAAFAGFEIALPWVLLGNAERVIPSALAGLLVAGVPLVGAVVAALLRTDDRVDRRRLWGLLLGLAGVALIVGDGLALGSPVAMLEMAVVVVCYASAPFILTHRLVGVPSLGIMSLALLMVAVGYAPVGLAGLPATLPGPDILLSIAILAVVCTAAAFVVFAALVREIGPVRTQVITYVNPIVAAVAGVAILGETLSPAMLGGFGLAIAGSALATRRTLPPPDPDAAAIELADEAPAG